MENSESPGLLKRVLDAIDCQRDKIDKEKEEQKAVIKGVLEIEAWEDAWHKGYQRGLSFGRSRFDDLQAGIEETNRHTAVTDSKDEVEGYET